MSLLDAPEYDVRRENLNRNLLIGAAALLVLLLLLFVGSFIAGHGWFFSNLPAEHRIDHFLTAIEQKDYPTAYGIYVNDSSWQQHAQKYSSYPLDRFTEDWTKYTDGYTAEGVRTSLNAPITSHKIEKSVTDGTGFWGTGIIVAATVNNTSKRLFIWYQRSDGTLTYPPPHIFTY